MTRDHRVDLIKQALISKGFSEDRFGHLKGTDPTGKTYRYKIQKNTIRFEVRSGDSWVRLRTFSIRKAADSVRRNLKEKSE